MKVLTIKQPWASLIIEGYKKYEFRSWKTNYRGKILIHAGLSLDKNAATKFNNYNLDYVNGAIIGEAEIVDCILIDEKFNEKLKNINQLVYGISNHIGDYAWKLDNIVKYDNPIYVKGKLGLWNYNVTHELRLNEEPFNKIKNGSKTIEMRLYDEKRKLIKENDIIEFTNRSTNEKIKVKVIKLHLFNSFNDLYDSFDNVSLGYDINDKKDPKDMEKYYSKEEQEKYGVVGIEIKLM